MIQLQAFCRAEIIQRQSYRGVRLAVGDALTRKNPSVCIFRLTECTPCQADRRQVR